jgi:phage terminase Nu1 subunit (DNA packaging protein)
VTTRGLLTRRELAKRFHVTPARVGRWENDGMPCAKPGTPGRASLYDAAAVRAWREAREERARRDGASVAEARAQKELWQARLAEQTHRARSGELLSAVAVRQVWSSHVAAVRARLLAWPTTLAGRLHRAGVTGGQPAIEHALDEEVRRVLTELSAGPIERERLDVPEDLHDKGELSHDGEP